MSKIDDAIAKITNESQGNRTLIIFEESLTSICTNDIIAEKIMDPNKKLKDCAKKTMESAKKQAFEGCAMVENEDVYEMIRKYYDISESDVKAHTTHAPSSNVIDITDLL